MTKLELMQISAETTVPIEMLLENDEFIDLVKSGANTQDLTDFVNENY
jgi:hypothetical protein